VDNRLNFPFEFGSQRDYIAPIALGDQSLLEKGSIFGIANHALQLSHQAVMSDAHIAADIPQFYGS
jgi:hypothetical protein